ncbi:MAG: hypothetical protein OHK0022_60460 [Roseiflexaceae bacterium]
MIERQHHSRTLAKQRGSLRAWLRDLVSHTVLVEHINGQQRVLGRYCTQDEALAAAASLRSLVGLRGGRMQTLRARGLHPRRMRPLVGLGLLLLIGVPGCWPVVAPLTLALLLGMLSSDLRWR